MMNDGMSRSEKWGIGLSVLLLLAVAGFYFSGASLKTLFLGDMQSQSQIQVGYVQMKREVLRRSKSGAVEFEEIQEKAGLFGNDTVVTSDNGAATLVLEDGSLIELGAGAMVKLAFDADLSLGGVSRITEVEVVAGSVTGRGSTNKVVIKSKSAGRVALSAERPVVIEEKEPVPAVIPKPADTPPPETVTPEVTDLQPSAGAHLRVPDGSQQPSVPVRFTWNFKSNAGSQLKLTLKKSDSGEVLAEQNVSAPPGAGEWSTTIQSPGNYVWNLSLADGRPLKEPATAQFVVDPDFIGIELGQGRFDGKPINDGLITNQISSVPVNEVSLVQEWRPYPDAEKYLAKAGGQTLEAKNPPFQWKGKRFPPEGLVVSVSARLKNGFVVHSNEIRYQSSYLPPKPTSPVNRAQVAEKQGTVDLRRDGILLSWQKTHFTDSYDLEVAGDGSFKGNVVKRQVKTNHTVFRGVKPGTYFWRVRAVQGTLKSEYSPIQQFTVTSF